MTPKEEADQEAWVHKCDWEHSYTKIPLHTIMPAEPGTFILWVDWPNVPHRERVFAWDINTAEDGWRWPITLSGVESDTGRPVLYSDGRVQETGFDGTTWSNMEDFICGEMQLWADKRAAKAKA